MIFRNRLFSSLQPEREPSSSSGSSMTRCALTDLGAFALGAGLMYVLDPSRGRRRRALARDKSVGAIHELRDAAEVTLTDLWNRSCGLVAELRGSFRSDYPSDEVLSARVRSKIGRVVSHPSAIRVAARDGCVTLSGPILKEEVDDLIAAARRVRGVCEVEDRLEPHKQRGDIPDLQGGTPRPGDRVDVAQENWAPGTRFVVGASGAGLAAYGLGRRDLPGTLLAALGAGLTLRAITNLEAKRLTGVGAGRQAVQIKKDINIAAPPDEVYTFWANYENFPLFMHNVREVRAHPSGQSHWVVAGPAGVRVEWDAVETQRIPGQLIAWKSVPGSAVASAGIVRFDPNPDGTTRVDVSLSYNPPAGAIGHAVATMFGADPKHEMDQDLARMKTLIETGNFPHDAAKAVQESGVPQ